MSFFPKSSMRGFSTIESLVVIAIMGALFFVLAPPAFYRLGWMVPPARDLEFEIKEVQHPTATRLPEKFRDEDESESPANE